MTGPPFPCRVMETRPCPVVYGEVCGPRPCARFESDDEAPWLPELTGRNPIMTDEESPPPTTHKLLDAAAERGHAAMFDGELAADGIERALWHKVAMAVLDDPALLPTWARAARADVETWKRAAAGLDVQLQVLHALLRQRTAERDAREAALGVPEIMLIVEERRRVIAAGRTPEHDDEHADGSLARAAAVYAAWAGDVRLPSVWPWPEQPKLWDTTDALVAAGQLIAAEIARLQRVKERARVRPATLMCPTCGRAGRERTVHDRGADPQCVDCHVKGEAGRAKLNAAYDARFMGAATAAQTRLIDAFEAALGEYLTRLSSEQDSRTASSGPAVQGIPDDTASTVDTGEARP